jgi:hypothetical protein
VKALWKINLVSLITVGLLSLEPLHATRSVPLSDSDHRHASPLEVVSEDPYSNRDTYHPTEAEPDTATNGSTVVATFQVGRAYTCGASNIGWSVSRNAGRSWTDEMLPGTTVQATPPGRWIRATDPVVAYDAKHDTWLVEGMGMPNCDVPWKIFISRSTDGARSFADPIVIGSAKTSHQVDKPGITCDNTPTSPYYGNCYTAWTTYRLGSRYHGRALASSDGGLTWSRSAVPRGPCPQNLQPVTQPNGSVVMPFWDDCPENQKSFVSTDGGASYSGPYDMPLGRTSAWGGVAGDLVAPPFLSADVDAEGTSYVAWRDCAFRWSPGHPCLHDIVFSTSDDGRHWTHITRIPTVPLKSDADFFLPTLAVDPTTSGSSAHIGVLYYFYPQHDCRVRTCQLSIGFISSTNGGSTWTSPLQLAGPFKNTWLPYKDGGTPGYFVGDYFGLSFVHGKAIAVFTVARKGTCELGDITSCNTWEASATITVRSKPSGTSTSLAPD